MIVEFDGAAGTIHSIACDGDALGTNFVGNGLNTIGDALRDPHRTGDIVTTAWRLSGTDWIRDQAPGPEAVYPRSGRWQNETTLASGDIRAAAFDGRRFTVRYEGESRNPEGIRSFRLESSFRAAPDGALLWEIAIENTSGRTLELGDLALPLRFNDDYAGPYGGLAPRKAIVEGKMAALQKTLHEQRVFAHLFVAGHGSYALVQRPKGDGPFLLIHGLDDTPFECAFKSQTSYGGDWIGTDLLAIHSWARHNKRGWPWNAWVNGHTSLVLEPGQKRAYRLRFVFIDDYPAIREELAKNGSLGIRVLPSMVVQEGVDALVEATTPSGLDGVEIHSDGVQVVENRRAGDQTLLRLVFKGRGQKSLKLLHGGGKWTWLHFYCVEDAAALIKARAKFMAERQYYENPRDPYNRNHLFLPFDARLGKMIEETEDVWEVGGTGDPGFGDPLFLAEKNVHYPSADEIAKLEAYVDDCLFRHIQDPETYEVRESLYYKARTPSSPSSSFSKARSEATWRTFNYTFVANIYHALYRIGKRYGLLMRRTAEDYLRMAYRTSLLWFTTGLYKHLGLITGSNAVEILADLEREGWSSEHARLLALMKECNEEFLRDPYPYASEIEIDETGQHQVYFFTRLFARRGDAASRTKNAEVVRALKALRGGDQPVWFSYGNDLFAHPDLRGMLSCWHSGSLNGLALLAAFEETGDPVALLKAYPGVMSVLRNVQPDGMGFAWFMYAPDVFGFEPPRTFEGGLGLWGFLRAAKAYVVEDPSFGWIGYGCRVEAGPEDIKAMPNDGVRKRLCFVAAGLDVEVRAGEIARASFRPKDGRLSLELADSTGLVRTARLTIRGLSAGDYDVGTAAGAERRAVADLLELERPMAEAADILIARA
jgi:hypothetical protein